MTYIQLAKARRVAALQSLTTYPRSPRTPRGGRRFVPVSVAERHIVSDVRFSFVSRRRAEATAPLALAA